MTLLRIALFLGRRIMFFLCLQLIALPPECWYFQLATFYYHCWSRNFFFITQNIASSSRSSYPRDVLGLTCDLQSYRLRATVR